MKLLTLEDVEKEDMGFKIPKDFDDTHWISSRMSAIKEVDWEDPRDFVDEGSEDDSLLYEIVASFRSIAARAKDLERLERMESGSDSELEEIEQVDSTSDSELEEPRVDAKPEESRVDVEFEKRRDDAKHTTYDPKSIYEAVLIFDEPDDLSDRESLPIFQRLSRRLRGGEDRIRFKNNTDSSVFVMCTQDLLTVLKSGEVGVNASLSGVEVKVDIANELVRTKELKSTLKIGPSESQDVRTTSKYVMVSAFAIRGEDMTLLFKDLVLKKGRKLVIQQKDIVNALTKREFEQLKLFSA
ncbi:hypothetical protein BGX20_004101 [Mortierella sp. AD010]|nr:hypothetical protein BGX20_004101 [Mortierella sp. AD010]